MQLHRLVYVLHRDLGYLAVGLSLVYGISGVTLNHIRDWNSNYRIERVAAQIIPLPAGVAIGPQSAPYVLRSLGEPVRYENIFLPDPSSIQIFVEGRSILANLRTGVVTYERATPRFLLSTLNALHLNNRQGRGWIAVADLFAGALVLLAVTGGAMLLWRKDRRRLLFLTLVGVLMPLIAALI